MMPAMEEFLADSSSTADFFTTFVFPFKFFSIKDGAEKFVAANDVADKLCSVNLEASKGWTEESFVIDDNLKYAEWHYFHPYFRDVAFSRKSHENEGMRYLVRKDYETLQVELLTQQEGERKTKTLRTRITSIDMHLFDNQIGFLTITTQMLDPLSFNEYLIYNDVARRVYPPFLQPPKPHQRSNTDEAKGLTVLAEKISLAGQCVSPIDECFKSVDLPSGALDMSSIVTKLLNPLRIASAHEKPEESQVYYRPFTDDRMFVVSYYSNAKLSEYLKRPICGQRTYESSDEWYKAIFVDGGDIGIKNEEMKCHLIRDHTYPRWAEYGTLFGMTRYSFVCLCGVGEFPGVHLRNHMKTMYYQIALIVLLRRAMLLRFSEDIKQLTRLLGKSGVTPKARKQADSLHLDFIRFTNKYWLTEITPQEQGIEIYNQWIQLLDHDALYEKVKNEISELATYLRVTIEHDTNLNIAWITGMGLPLSIIIAVWTIWLAVYGEGHVPNIFRFLSWPFDPWRYVLLVIYVVTGIVFAWQFTRFLRQWSGGARVKLGKFLKNIFNKGGKRGEVS